MIGTLPVAASAPLDYLYALDAAMPILSDKGAPVVRCNIPQLTCEIRQRIPRWVEVGKGAAALWVEPLIDTWQAELHVFTLALPPGAPLVIVASRPLARLLPECRGWSEHALGLWLAGLGQLQRALCGTGFILEAEYGIHSISAIGLNLVSRLVEDWQRPDLADRLHFTARLHYCTQTPLKALATVALLIARKDQAMVRQSNDTGHRKRRNHGQTAKENLTIAPVSLEAKSTAVLRLDAWLETMRGPGGYTGPVAHWWQQSLLYTGAGLDWRYEGIIGGYLQLWKRTGNGRWLAKARRAGDDLVAGQLNNGHYATSAFEMNPATAGTPHEAACNVGLLLLALALRQAGELEWESYANCAERNLRSYYIDQLWDDETQSFWDNPDIASFVPNKAATVCEALFLLAELTGEAEWVERYALPTLSRVLEHQVVEKGPLNGAIAQNSFGKRKVEKYFPIYIARCVPALVRGHNWTKDGRYAEAALQAMQFITRWGYDDGLFPAVIYPGRRVNRYPGWVAPLGDILRAADEVRHYGFDADFGPTEQRLLYGQDTSGGIQTANGFAAQVGGHTGCTPDLRDVLHVAGWCDKAFRYLASHADAELPNCQSMPFETACVFRGQAMWLIETPAMMEITRKGEVCYRWNKGEQWPEIASMEFALR